MATFDYDVVIVGSGFGGSVAALRAAEKGYRVHVYEWSREEVVQAVESAGLVVEDTMGLLPPEPQEVAVELAERFGAGAVDWYRALAARVPKALLDTVSSVAVPDRATELLFVCRRPA